MNFNQWQKYAEKKDVSRLTYICGDQSTLVELVVDDIRTILDAPATDYVSLDAVKSPNFWEVTSQYSIDPNVNRLILVRNAQTISSWSEIYDWWEESKSNPRSYLVFVSTEADGPAVYDKGKKVSYLDHIELIRNKGKFIKCGMPNTEDLISWCSTYNLTRNSAEFLIAKTSGDVAKIYSVLKKVHVWKSSPNTKALDLLCDSEALDSVADYLILGDKKSAYRALAHTQDYAKILSRLDSRLDMLTDINRYVVRRMYDNDIAQTTGINIFLVKKFKNVSRDYEFSKVKHRRQLLAVADSALRSGAVTGVMESVIALW